jgi:hypothetical protein
MAADAIARQYDVDKNRVTLVCEAGKGSYRPGVITFFPKVGKSIDLRTMEESLRATRLSGGTSMSMDYLDITAVGDLLVTDETVLLKVSGTSQELVLREAKDGNKNLLQRLRASVSAGDKVVSVTGRVEGWSGRFPVMLNGLAQRGADAPVVLFVSDFEIGKK